MHFSQWSGAIIYQKEKKILKKSIFSLSSVFEVCLSHSLSEQWTRYSHVIFSSQSIFPLWSFRGLHHLSFSHWVDGQVVLHWWFNSFAKSSGPRVRVNRSVWGRDSAGQSISNVWMLTCCAAWSGNVPNCTSSSDAWGTAYAPDFPIGSTDRLALNLAPCMALCGGFCTC